MSISNSSPPNKEPLLNAIPLRIFVSQILGDYDEQGKLDGIVRNHDYVEVHPIIAEILYAVCRNKHTVYVQFPNTRELSITGRPITVPIVWRWEKFTASTELWLAQKARAEEERRAHFILNHNIQQATKTIMCYTEVSEEFALPLAVKMVKNDEERKIIAMGGKPFVRKWEDLP